MKRLGFAGALIACTVAPLWSAAARVTSVDLHGMLAIPAFLCRFIPVPTTLVGLLLVGLGIVALATLVSLLLARKTGQTVRALTADAEPPPDRLLSIALRAGLRGRFAITRCAGPVAFTHGFANPRVVLSRDLYDCLDDAELEAVLRHEYAHVQRRDPLRVLIARTLGTAFAFIPFARPALETYLCQIELAADRATVQAMADVVPLASALHRVITRQPRPEFAMAAVSGLSATDVRIGQLLGLDTSPASIAPPPGRLHVALFWLAVLASLCVLIASASSAVSSGLCFGCW